MSIIRVLVKGLCSRGMFKGNIEHSFTRFNCRKCRQRSAVPRCEGCSEMVDFFGVFGIEDTFEIESKTIRMQSKQLQKQFHPDHNACTKLHDEMTEISSHINKARDTLLNDFERAAYLLHIRGVDIDEAQLDDGPFLTVMFEMQEQIQDANQQQILKLQLSLNTQLHDLKKYLERSFKTNQLPACKEAILKGRYLQRAIFNLEKKKQAFKDTTSKLV